jgi:uncharacterized protein involved in outer membrane biogenesis
MGHESPARRPKRHGLAIAGGAATLAIAAFAIGEAAGWPWLAGPFQRLASERLGREVSFAPATGAEGASGFSLRLIGGLRAQASRLVVADLGGGTNPPFAAAEGVRVALRWRDLLPALAAGRVPPIEAFTADALHLHAWRRADGTANWRFAAAESDGAAGAGVPVTVRRLAVGRLTAQVDDAPLALEARVQAALDTAGADAAQALVASARGTWRGTPLAARLQSGSPLPAAGRDPAVPLRLWLDAGRAAFTFTGTVADPWRLGALHGAWQLSGPSLAVVGAPFGVVLPTTPRFAAQGLVSHAVRGPEGVWLLRVDTARVGRSELAGDFAYDARGARGRLDGRLAGPRLRLADLGPAIGAPGAGDGSATARADGRVIPDRRLDLPSLAAMDAAVQVSLRSLELSDSGAVRAIAPLAARLVLERGVLRLTDLVAGFAQGRVEGELRLDASDPSLAAAWRTRLRLSGVRLERAVPALRRPGDDTPWAQGAVGGTFAVEGRGRSVAELLASADGDAALWWREGRLSQLAVEAAGLDVAQGLGRLLRGDKALEVRCGVARLRIADGVLTPEPAIVDTGDSTLWLAGRVSLAEERLDLRLHVAPKDRSVLALRTPLAVQGRLAAPDVSVAERGLARRLAPAALLALAHPLAALLPLVDTGDREEAGAVARACEAAR